MLVKAYECDSSEAILENNPPKINRDNEIRLSMICGGTSIVLEYSLRYNMIVFLEPVVQKMFIGNKLIDDSTCPIVR